MPGDRLTDAAAQRARRRLERHLRRTGWWEAGVSPPEIVAAERGAVLRLRVRSGPRYRLELAGIELSGALEQDALPFLRGDEPFSGEAEDAALAVRRFLQRKRHLLASASAAVTDDGGVRTLRVKATPGPKLSIKRVSFPGLTAVPEAELMERVGVRERGLVPWGREPVDDTTLAADGASVLAVLRRHGYAEAAVETPRVSAVGRSFHVELPVVEGPRHTVAAIDVTGLPADFTAPTLPLKSGGPWSSVAAQESANTLAGALRDAAYLDAWIESSHTCAEASCRVTLTAHPGERTEVQRVVVSGLGRTKVRDRDQARAPADAGAARHHRPARRAAPAAQARPLPAGDAAPHPRPGERRIAGVRDRRRGGAHPLDLVRRRLGLASRRAA